MASEQIQAEGTTGRLFAEEKLAYLQDYLKRLEKYAKDVEFGDATALRKASEKLNLEESAVHKLVELVDRGNSFQKAAFPGGKRNILALAIAEWERRIE